MLHRLGLLALAAGCAVLGFTTTSAIAKSVNFSDKTVRVIVPFKEGGGSDTYARTLQVYLAKYLPGKPKVVVENMPGGGSIKGANAFQKADPDGLTAMVASTSTFTSAVFGGKKVKFDMTSWEPVVLSPQGSALFAASVTGIVGQDPKIATKTLAGSNQTFGIKSPTASELRAFAAFNLLGVNNIKPILGLGAGERRQSMIRGETTLGVEPFAGFSSKVKPYIDSGELALFATMGFVDKNGNVVRDPGMPNTMTVPEIYETIHGKAPSGPLWQAYLNFLNMSVMTSKSLSLPAGTPPEIVAAWKNAVDATLQDPDFRKVSGKVLGPYPQIFGEEAKAAVRGALDMDVAQRNWLFAWIEERMGVPIGN